MRPTRTAVATAAALAALLAAAGTAVADATSPSAAPSADPSSAPAADPSAAPSTDPSAGSRTPKVHKAPTGDGARALCKRVPKIDARIDRALARLNGPATERGSVARLQKRVDNANTAGDTAVATYLKDKLTFRTSLVPTLNRRSTDLDAVRTWCGTQDFTAKGGTK
ncbi:hypothetical protein ACIO6U_13815 [Streptomyces sp. NPDC087422]|uniref:hypothetical protein n=1 Tax=Streptomyces sp. NPDC087422 TaxID=3365786 RepID=UPI0037F684F0